MNFHELKRQLEEIDLERSLPVRTFSGNANTSYLYHFSNLQEFKTAIDKLEKFEFFQHLIDPIKETAVYTDSYKSTVTVTSDTDTKIGNAISRLKSFVNTIKDFLYFYLPEEKENSIRIKLPQADDFDELSKILSDLKKAISIPVSEVGGQVVIERGESGSIWLLVYLGTQMAVKIVGELSWAAMVLLRKKQDIDFVNLQFQDYKLDLEYKATLVDAQKKLVNKLVESEAENIQNHFELGNDSERQQRLILSIKTIADLFERGAEIRPGIETSKEITQLFPAKNQLPLIESRTKRLSEGEDKP